MVELIQVLRKCYVCGKEAHSKEDLVFFSIGSARHKHGRENLCKECRNQRRRRGNMWDVAKTDSRKTLASIHNKKMINFKGKKTYLGFNPRTNVCSSCSKKYPDELDKQTCLHHTEYDETDPLKHTIELCSVCHGKLHVKENNFWKTAPSHIKYRLKDIDGWLT